MKHKISDCFYYYNGYCYKGNACSFRHEPRALGSQRVCKWWRRRCCFVPRCPLRHSDFRRRPLAALHSWGHNRPAFLKGRCLVTPGRTCDSEKWIRKVSFESDCRQSLCSEHDERGGETPLLYRQGQNIRIVLEHLCGTASSFGNIFSGNHRAENENPLVTSSKIKNETSATMVLNMDSDMKSQEITASKLKKDTHAVYSYNRNEHNGLFQGNSSQRSIQPDSTSWRSTGEAVQNDTKCSIGNLIHGENNSTFAVLNSNYNLKETSNSCSEDTINNISSLNEENVHVSKTTIDAKNNYYSESYLRENEILANEDQNEHASEPVVFTEHNTKEKSDLNSEVTEISSKIPSQKSSSSNNKDSEDRFIHHVQNSVRYYTRLQARIRAESEKPVECFDVK